MIDLWQCFLVQNLFFYIWIFTAAASASHCRQLILMLPLSSQDTMNINFQCLPEPHTAVISNYQKQQTQIINTLPGLPNTVFPGSLPHTAMSRNVFYNTALIPWREEQLYLHVLSPTWAGWIKQSRWRHPNDLAFSEETEGLKETCFVLVPKSALQTWGRTTSGLTPAVQPS